MLGPLLDSDEWEYVSRACARSKELVKVPKNNLGERVEDEPDGAGPQGGYE